MKEQDWEAHDAYIKFIGMLANLGIDMSKWYFSECMQYPWGNYLSIDVYYGNNSEDDITMHVQYLRRYGAWKFEGFSISSD